MGPSSAPAIKTIFKIHDGGQPVCLSDQFCITTRRWDFLIFKMAAVSYLGFLKLIFLTAMHHNAKFCGDRSYRYKDIAIFHIFLMKCKNSRAYRS